MCLPSVDGKGGREARPRSVETDADVCGAAAEDGGDLASVQALPGVEEQDLPVSFRQGRKRRDESLAALIGVVGRIRRMSGKTTGSGLLSASRTLQVEPRVPCDSEQPGPLVVRNIVDPTPGDEKRLRHDVVGERRGSAKGVATDRLEVALVKLGEAFFSGRHRR